MLLPITIAGEAGTCEFSSAVIMTANKENSHAALIRPAQDDVGPQETCLCVHICNNILKLHCIHSTELVFKAKFLPFPVLNVLFVLLLFTDRCMAAHDPSKPEVS